MCSSIDNLYDKHTITPYIGICKCTARLHIVLVRNLGRTPFCEIVHRVIAIGGKFVYHIVNVQNRAYYEDRI